MSHYKKGNIFRKSGGNSSLTKLDGKVSYSFFKNYDRTKMLCRKIRGILLLSYIYTENIFKCSGHKCLFQPELTSNFKQLKCSTSFHGKSSDSKHYQFTVSTTVRFMQAKRYRSFIRTSTVYSAA